MTLTVTQFVGSHHDILDAEFVAAFPDLRFNRSASERELLDVLPETNVLITSSILYTPALAREVIRLARKLEWIQFTAVGLDDIDPDDLPAGVLLTNAKGARTKVIAGHAMGLMLGLMRGLRLFEPYRLQRSWARDDIGKQVTTTDDRTMVIVGMGDVGHDIARKAKAFDFTVIGVSRAAKPGGAIDAVVPRGELATALAKADVVMVSAALDQTNHHMIGATEIAAMKKSAIIVNVARGALIDEAALATALKERRIAGAGLDVTEIEPLPPESPLWDLANVIISPHVAGQGAHSQKRILKEIVAENLARFQQGQPLRNAV